jgi:predicted nucleic acid-binding protein
MPIVIDANIALALAVPLPYSGRVQQLVQEWRDEAVRLVVPALWGYEVISGIRKAVTAHLLTTDEADEAIQELWSLDIKEVPGTVERHRRALSWAARLGQMVAYDAQYLVVAEELEAAFWTADRSLSEGTRSLGADWVHWVGPDT